MQTNLKILKKLLIAISLIILLNVAIVATNSFAYETSDDMSEMVNPIKNPENYDPTEYVDKSPVTIKITAKIVKWIRNLGVIIGVIVLTIVGVKYMLAGAAEEKAQYKETLVPIVIGVVMLLGSITLIVSIAKLFD